MFYLVPNRFFKKKTHSRPRKLMWIFFAITKRSASRKLFKFYIPSIITFCMNLKNCLKNVKQLSFSKNIFGVFPRVSIFSWCFRSIYAKKIIYCEITWIKMLFYWFLKEIWKTWKNEKYRISRKKFNRLFSHCPKWQCCCCCCFLIL